LVTAWFLPHPATAFRKGHGGRRENRNGQAASECLVAAVAHGCGPAVAACAPTVSLAGFHPDLHGAFLGDGGLGIGHGNSLEGKGAFALGPGTVRGGLGQWGDLLMATFTRLQVMQRQRTVFLDLACSAGRTAPGCWQFFKENQPWSNWPRSSALRTVIMQCQWPFWRNPRPAYARRGR
jgi:hypothetical protein